MHDRKTFDRGGSGWLRLTLAMTGSAESIDRKPYYSSRTRFFEAEMNVGRLVTPPVRDAASGDMIEVGPTIDDAQSWANYRRARLDRRYATDKRMLSARELRRYGLRNAGGLDKG